MSRGLESYEFFRGYDPAEVSILNSVLNKYLNWTQIAEVFDLMLDASCDDGAAMQIFNGVEVSIQNSIDCQGSGEYSSQERGTTAYINRQGVYLCEVGYRIGTAHCCESQLLEFEVILSDEVAAKELQEEHGNKQEKEKTVANLSKRVYDHLEETSTKTTYIKTTGVNTMTTIKTVNITLINENPNLKGEAKIVFQKMGYVTEYNDNDTKMNIIASGKVALALIKHNEEVLTKTIDKGIQRTTGRDVMLEPIELLSDSMLTWNIIQVA